MTILWPNKSPEPTAVGACRSAVAVHVASRRWLSFLRYAAFCFRRISCGYLLWRFLTIQVDNARRVRTILPVLTLFRLFAGGHQPTSDIRHNKSLEPTPIVRRGLALRISGFR